MQRRRFIQGSAQAGLALGILGLGACNTKKKEEAETSPDALEGASGPFFKLSLAQWSINRAIRNDGLDPYTFAAKAKGWGFEGLEYVSGLYYPELEKDGYSASAMQSFVDRSGEESERHGLENLLIMVDGQGNLSAADAAERELAVESHHKWIDAAAALGCHSIRINLQGAKEADVWKEASVAGLTALCTYAAEHSVNVLVENHGGLSSDAARVADIMRTVGMDNCGTLPDFGNFCVKRADGSYYNGECLEEYDRYQGTEELMPFAKAVSAKSYDFGPDGEETTIDYGRMLDIVKAAGYTGYIGVEYEGSRLSEEAGIKATADLLLKKASGPLVS